MSDVVREPGSARASLLSMVGGGYVPCFTVFSLFELRRRPKIYEAFLDFFDLCPCILLKGYDELFEAELAAYPDSGSVDPVVLGFSPLNRDKGTNLRALLERAFAEADTIQRERAWPQLKQTLLSGWLDLKPNYAPKGSRYTGDDGRTFVDITSLQAIAERNLEWFRSQTQQNLAIDTSAFPSIRLTLWTVFFRLYVYGDRSAEIQDVFDVLISTSSPYLDAVVTEKHQANIYEHVKRHDTAIRKLEVLTLKDLRCRS